jgi:hypothetical protein
MNRIKLWVYVLVIVGVGVWSTRGRSVVSTARAVAIADARLQSAVGQLDGSLKLIESRAAAVAALAALDERLVSALAAPSAPAPKGAKVKGKKAPPPPPTARDEEAEERALEAAARSAVGAAEKSLGFELPPLAFYAAADKGGIAKKLKAAADGPQREAVAFLADAARGKPRRAFARVNDGLWYGVGIPMAGGGALVLFVPLDEGWARRLKAGAGVDVTLSAGLPKAVTTLPPPDAKAIVAAALVRAGTLADAGKLPRIDAGFSLPFKVPALPLLFGTAPGARAQAVALSGVKDGYAVLSVPVAPLLGGVVRAEWTGLLLAAGALALGAIVSLLLHGEAPPQVPADLLQAAARIERGDFGARVPTMAGKYGTVAAALNRAADAASHVAAALESPDGTQQFFGRAPTHPDEAPQEPLDLRPPASPPPHVAAVVPRPEPTPQAFSTTSRMDGAAVFGDAFGAPPEAPAAPARDPEAEEEERHWEQTFDEFLRVREECGEASDGLTLDRFRVKLEKNKQTLVQKYGCRTVRFQVYVKDGKAALKATPVK